MKNFNKNQKGFTLIELLVVIGILAILLAITLIAINPARQFAQANNTKRSSDVNAILNAIGQYSADNAGQRPGGLTAPFALANVADTGANVCADIVPTYISALPSDPTAANGGTDVTAADCAGAYDTEYQVAVDASGRVTVSVLPANEELGQAISVSR